MKLKITQTISIVGKHTEYEINTFKDIGYCYNVWRVNSLTGKKEFQKQVFGIRDKLEFFNRIKGEIEYLKTKA